MVYTNDDKKWKPKARKRIFMIDCFFKQLFWILDHKGDTGMIQKLKLKSSKIGLLWNIGFSYSFVFLNFSSIGAHRKDNEKRKLGVQKKTFAMKDGL